MFFFGGLEFLIPIALIGLFVIAVVALAHGPRESDPNGRRPYAIYLGLATFIALFVTLFAGFATVNALARWAFLNGDEFVAPEQCISTPTGTECTFVGGSGFDSQKFALQAEEVARNDQYLGDAVETAIVLVVAVVVLWFHLRRIRTLLDAATTGEREPRSTLRGYLYGVCFTAVLIFLVAGAVAATGLFKVAAPGIAETQSFGQLVRDQGYVQLFSNLALAAGAWLIFRAHWQRAERWRTDASGPDLHDDEPLESPGPR